MRPNGVRIVLTDAETEEAIALDPLELEAICRMTHTDFAPMILDRGPRMRPDPAPDVHSGRALHLTAFALTIVAVSAVSLIAPSLPELARSYGVTEATMAWIQSAVLVPGLIAAPVAMRLTRRHGLRRVLVVALMLYGLAGVSHVVASPFAVAVLTRGLQGVGGAALLASGFALLAGGFALLGRLPDEQRARGVAANAPS